MIHWGTSSNILDQVSHFFLHHHLHRSVVLCLNREIKYFKKGQVWRCRDGGFGYWVELPVIEYMFVGGLQGSTLSQVTKNWPRTPVRLGPNNIRSNLVGQGLSALCLIFENECVHLLDLKISMKTCDVCINAFHVQWGSSSFLGPLLRAGSTGVRQRFRWDHVN